MTSKRCRLCGILFKGSCCPNCNFNTEVPVNVSRLLFKPSKKAIRENCKKVGERFENELKNHKHKKECPKLSNKSAKCPFCELCNECIRLSRNRNI